MICVPLFLDCMLLFFSVLKRIVNNIQLLNENVSTKAQKRVSWAIYLLN